MTVDGEVVPVEALSMMLHAPAYLPGLSDSYDGQVPIAVCTSPETVRGMTPLAGRWRNDHAGDRA